MWFHWHNKVRSALARLREKSMTGKKGVCLVNPVPVRLALYRIYSLPLCSAREGHCLAGGGTVLRRNSGRKVLRTGSLSVLGQGSAASECRTGQVGGTQ